MTLDLNLLVALDALLQERSVTAAAGRLHLSVPATSRTLARIRAQLGDELLVRAGREYVLTPRAVELQPRVRALVEEARALTSEAPFDPQTLRRAFALRMNDGSVIAVGGRLIEAARAQAPHVVLRFLPEGDEDVTPLRDGAVDLDVGVAGDSAPDVRLEPLGEERMVGVVARTHPLASGARVTRQRFAAAEHVIASRRGRRRGPIDDALAPLERTIVATTGTTGAALLLAASTNVVATLPPSIARTAAASLGLTTFALPVDVPPLRYSMTWHARFDRDPAHAWLRGLVRAAYAGLLR